MNKGHNKRTKNIFLGDIVEEYLKSLPEGESRDKATGEISEVYKRITGNEMSLVEDEWDIAL